MDVSERIGHWRRILLPPYLETNILAAFILYMIEIAPLPDWPHNATKLAKGAARHLWCRSLFTELKCLMVVSGNRLGKMECREERSVPPPFNVWNTVVRHKNMAIVGLWVSCDGGSAENLVWWIWFTGANFILRWNWNLDVENVPDVYIIKFRLASYRQYIDVWGSRCPDEIKAENPCTMVSRRRPHR